MSKLAPYWETRGNVNFREVTSEEEINWLHSQVLEEEIRLNQILEKNNSNIINLGIADKVETAYVITSLGSMFTNWAVNGMNPSSEKIMLCMARVFATVGPYTQFRVGENLLADFKNKKPNTNSLHIGMARESTITDRLPGGAQAIWLEVGSRIMEGGKAVEFVSKDISSTGISLDEEQLEGISGMIDSFMQEAAYGELPHLCTSGEFDSLIVPGLAVSES